MRLKKQWGLSVLLFVKYSLNLLKRLKTIRLISQIQMDDRLIIRRLYSVRKAII